MPRIRGVSRTQTRPKHKDVGESLPPDGRQDRGSLSGVLPAGGGTATHSSRSYMGRGRAIWCVYCAGQKHLIRASPTHTHPEIREMFIEAVNPEKTKDLTVVQAGGLGEYYDADDRTRAVDLDFTEAEEAMGVGEAEEQIET